MLQDLKNRRNPLEITFFKIKVKNSVGKGEDLVRWRRRKVGVGPARKCKFV